MSKPDDTLRSSAIEAIDDFIRTEMETVYNLNWEKDEKLKDGWTDSGEHFSPEFKFNEDKLLNELYDYIAETYTGHYTGEKYQATDLIIDAGHGEGFCIGNIIKYAKRYGKKDGYNEKDIMKILHYGIILLYNHRQKNV